MPIESPMARRAAGVSGLTYAPASRGLGDFESAYLDPDGRIIVGCDESEDLFFVCDPDGDIAGPYWWDEAVTELRRAP